MYNLATFSTSSAFACPGGASQVIDSDIAVSFNRELLIQVTKHFPEDSLIKPTRTNFFLLSENGGTLLLHPPCFTPNATLPVLQRQATLSSNIHRKTGARATIWLIKV